MENLAYTIKAKSSSGEPYFVVFDFTEKLMRVSCSCTAGSFAQMCKHKSGFLNGEIELLFDETDREMCRKVGELVKTSNYFSEFEILQSKLNEIENKKKQLAKEAKILKSDFGKRLRDGI